MFIDCGYRINHGKIAATNWLDPSYEIIRENGAYNREGQNGTKIPEGFPRHILHLGIRWRLPFRQQNYQRAQ